MIHYHGGPIWPESCAFRAWRGRHAFISWARVGLGKVKEAEQIELAASVCQSFALDNGAFTIWTKGGTVDWDDYAEWAGKWLRHPACDWAVIPDVIGGTEAENDALLLRWPWGHAGVPVWHLNESPERLQRLADDWPRVALGSCAEYDVRKPRQAIARLAEVLPAISDDGGTPLVKLHGLRMLNPAITTVVPLSSADSTNVAQNISKDVKWRGPYEPASKETKVDVLIERIESHPTPSRMDFVAHLAHPTLWEEVS